MPDSLASQLDIAAYLVPGYLVLLSLLYAYEPTRLRVQRQKLGAGEILASILAALLIGVALHRISGFALSASEAILRQKILVATVERFESLPAVQAKVIEHLGFTPPHLVDSYFYGRILVDERAPRTAVAAERLMSMALLCRNMLIAIPLAGAILVSRLFKESNHKVVAIAATAAGALILEFFFLKGYQSYLSASVWRILRAVLLMD
jgi:hypothetical protein